MGVRARNNTLVEMKVVPQTTMEAMAAPWPRLVLVFIWNGSLACEWNIAEGNRAPSFGWSPVSVNDGIAPAVLLSDAPLSR